MDYDLSRKSSMAKYPRALLEALLLRYREVHAMTPHLFPKSIFDKIN